MSRRAIKAINWSALAEKIPETEKAAFAAFKAKSDQHLRRFVRFLLFLALGRYIIYGSLFSVEIIVLCY